MMTSGGNSILLLRPVTFIKTHSVASTSAESSWLAEPNSGQMLEYPILARINPPASVMTVAKYTLQTSLRQPSAWAMSSTLNSS